MTWVLDTNILSEVRKGPRCHPNVAAWWAGVNDDEIFLSVLTLGEIRQGIERVRPRDSAKADALDRWLREVTVGFSGRIIGVDAAVAEACRAEPGHREASRRGNIPKAILRGEASRAW